MADNDIINRGFLRLSRAIKSIYRWRFMRPRRRARYCRIGGTGRARRRQTPQAVKCRVLNRFLFWEFLELRGLQGSEPLSPEPLPVLRKSQFVTLNDFVVTTAPGV